MKYAALLLTFASLGLVSCAAENGLSKENNAKIDQLILQRDCRGADNFASQTYSGAARSAVLGVIAENCWHDNKKAIEYYKLCAANGAPGCNDEVVRLGGRPSSGNSNSRQSP